LDWLYLSLVCAFSLATSDALSKKYLQGYTAEELVVVRFAYCGALLAPWLFTRPMPHVPPAFWLWVACAVPLEIIAMLFYMKAVRDAQLSLSQPLLAFTPVFTVPIAFMLVGERVSRDGLLGIALVVLGTFVLNLRDVRGGWRSLGEPFKALADQEGARLMLAVAAIYGLTSVMGKAALQYLPASTFGPFYFVLVGAVTLVVFLLRRAATGKALIRRPLPHLLISGLFAFMIYTHFLALEKVEASYMIAVKRTSILFSVVYGGVLFGEPGLAKRLLAATLMVAGVATIVLKGHA
jgi:drug/metabolite transporter (DMT)-like permease